MRTSLVIILFFVSMLGLFNPALAAEGSSYWINPMYDHLFAPGFVPPEPEPIRNRAVPDTCRSYEEVVEAMRQNFENREESFSFVLEYGFQFSQVENILDEAYNEISTDDYLRLNVKFWSSTWTGYDGRATIYLTVEYLTTLEQEQYVNQRVDEILLMIISDAMNDEQKEKAIHDWIVLNLEYDQTYQHYSAYAALNSGSTVCQGYSLLTFKMLKEEGIRSKIIESDQMNHAWNLIRLCGDWYHLDVTWDDPIGQEVDFIGYAYYNKSDGEIGSDHQWDNSAYPSAAISYAEGVCENWPPMAGDINHKDGVNLQDAILALQVSSGMESSEPVYFEADVNGNDVIGMVEAVFALQTVAGLRH